MTPFERLYWPTYTGVQNNAAVFKLTSLENNEDGITYGVEQTSDSTALHGLLRHHQHITNYRGAHLKYVLYKLWKKNYQLARYALLLKRMQSSSEESDQSQQKFRTLYVSAKLNQKLLKTLYVDLEMLYLFRNNRCSQNDKIKRVNALRQLMFQPV